MSASLKDRVDNIRRIDQQSLIERLGKVQSKGCFFVSTYKLISHYIPDYRGDRDLQLSWWNIGAAKFNNSYVEGEVIIETLGKVFDVNGLEYKSITIEVSDLDLWINNRDFESVEKILRLCTHGESIKLPEVGLIILQNRNLKLSHVVAFFNDDMSYDELDRLNANGFEIIGIIEAQLKSEQ